MQINDEGKIGIALALIGIGGGAALYVLPHPYADYIGWSLIGFSVIGLILLAAHHFKAFIASVLKPQLGWKWMWPQYVMPLGLIASYFKIELGHQQIQLRQLRPARKRPPTEAASPDTASRLRGWSQLNRVNSL